MWQKCLGRHYKILWIPDQIKNMALRRGKKESFLENQVIIESLVLCVPVPETLRKLCLPVVLSLMWRMLTKPPCSKWALSSSASHAIASDTANNTPPISRPAIFWLISEYGTKLERSPDKYISDSLHWNCIWNYLLCWSDGIYMVFRQIMIYYYVSQVITRWKCLIHFACS